MSAEFRHVANRNGSGKSERLVRAAVSAFCSLTRPTRREINQLAQLVLPLLNRVPVDSRRFVSAALSDSRYAPHELVLRLCEEPVDICAPLLIRSPLLGNGDLVRIIGRMGPHHAAAMLRRQRLHPAIAALATKLGDAEVERPSTAIQTQGKPPAEEPSSAVVEPERRTSFREDAEEEVRKRLRQIMAGSSAGGSASKLSPVNRGFAMADRDYERLKANVLSGNRAFFQSALADTLGIDYATAQAIVASRDYDDLIAAFRHIGLSEEEAFLLVCAACPDRFQSVEEIRAFADRYRSLRIRAADRKVGEWKPAAADGRASSEGEVVPFVRVAGGDRDLKAS